MHIRASFIVAVGLGLALLLAACGDDDDGDDADSVATGTPATAATSSIGTPAGGAMATVAGPATVRVAQHPTHGAILVDAQGRTLYRFTRDTPGVSNCYDSCAQTWPPVTMASGTPRGEGVSGELTLIDRRDGTKQVAFQGMPLYRYAADTAPGDAKGENVGMVWFVIKLSQAGGGGSGAAAAGEYSY